MRENLIEVTRRLARELRSFSPAAASHVYNPLEYAWDAQRQYLERYGVKRGRVLLLGMNPGPWGMAQTGVPFGDAVMVRDWIGIETPLGSPLPEQHRKYPILGFDCHRHEGSGRRLWGWARERFGTAENFFSRFFVGNYCPLLFVAEGRNLTPERLGHTDTKVLTEICNRALIATVAALEPVRLFGIGRYAERRAREVLDGRVPIDYLPHPSPASPAANRGWSALADAALGPWLDHSACGPQS